jgi:hypothetical protein
MSTVREILTSTYGDNWAKSIDHVVTVADSGYPDYRPVVIIAHTKSNDVLGYDDAAKAVSC